MSWSEIWFLLILVELLTITNINKNHLSSQYIEWWSTISPISTKITSHLNSLSDGQQFHQYQQSHLSPQLIEWWSTIPPPISTKITSHFTSMSDGQQFHQYRLKSPLTSTHWVMTNNSTNFNKHHLSLQLIEWWSTIPLIEVKWEVIFVDIGGGIVDHHSMSWSERWCLLKLVELLVITQWVEVRGDFSRYWWNCWPSQPIWTKITPLFNSLSDS